MTFITIQDVRNAGYCASGARRWFESYGLDFMDFLHNGIEITRFLGTGDAMAQRVVDVKQELVDG